MARFLSPEWLAELDQAVRSRPDLAAATADVRLVIEQRVTDATTYHVVLDHGTASVQAGPAEDPTVTFTQDEHVARSIAMGEASAQRAFMANDLRVGGDLQALLAAQPVLSALGDVFAKVRASTDFGSDLTPDQTPDD